MSSTTGINQYFFKMRSKPTPTNMSIEHKSGLGMYFILPARAAVISHLEDFNSCLTGLPALTFGMAILSPKSLQIMPLPCKNLLMTFHCLGKILIPLSQPARFCMVWLPAWFCNIIVSHSVLTMEPLH